MTLIYDEFNRFVVILLIDLSSFLLRSLIDLSSFDPVTH